jgi:hypothetical protein
MKMMKNKKHLSSSGWLAVFSLFFLAGLSIWACFMDGNLAISMLSNALTLSLTYFLIDKLKDKIKEKEQLPAECLLYEKLLKIIERFLPKVLPEKSYMMNRKTYQFKEGNITIVSRIELRGKENFSDLVKYFADHDIQYKEPLEQIKLELDDFLVVAASQLGPELLELVLKFRNTLLRELSPESLPEKEAKVVVSHWLSALIVTAADIRIWLQKILDKHFEIIE